MVVKKILGKNQKFLEMMVVKLDRMLKMKKK